MEDGVQAVPEEVNVAEEAGGLLDVTDMCFQERDVAMGGGEERREGRIEGGREGVCLSV